MTFEIKRKGAETIANKRPPGFMIYEENIKLLDTVPDEQAGRIIKAVSSFYVSGELPTLTEPIEQAVVNTLIESVIKDAAKYAETCEKNKENALKRWHGEEEGKERGTVSIISRINA